MKLCLLQLSILLAASVSSATAHCGLAKCNEEVWSRMAGDYTCGARITHLIYDVGQSEDKACRQVGGQEFPHICGECDPSGARNGDPPTGPHPTPHPTPAPKEYVTDGHRCGCTTCTNSIWYRDANGKTCGERIESLVKNNGYKMEDACHKVAGEEFPLICGAHGLLGCDPEQCYRDFPLKARTDLYCFPDFDSRTRYRNMWGRYTVEVKESDGICDPSNNKFSTRTVERVDNNKLRLKFKKVGDAWEGAEVRIRLPVDQMPFRYGTFAFNVSNVRVFDKSTGNVVSKVLPQSLVMGMNTWDATEDFQTHENFNHEVAVVLSKADNPVGPDAQFSVAPEGGYPLNGKRFYTGDADAQSYQQAPRKYSIDWQPAQINFSSNAGGGQTFTFSTEKALAAGEPDFVQCLPADVEVRISLWNLFGTLPPPDMTDKMVAQVVIDDFRYTPSDLTHVSDGGRCSKDCHCSHASMCFQNKCQPIPAHHRSLAEGKDGNDQAQGGLRNSKTA